MLYQAFALTLTPQVLLYYLLSRHHSLERYLYFRGSYDVLFVLQIFVFHSNRVKLCTMKYFPYKYFVNN